MAASPKISIRLSPELQSCLIAEAEAHDETPSATARRLLSKSLRNKSLMAMRSEGRPKGKNENDGA